MSIDSNQLATYVSHELCLSAASLSSSYYYQSLPFCIIDSIFSLGVRYGQVEKIVRNFSTKYNWQLFRDRGSLFPNARDQKTVTNFLALFANVQSPAIEIFDNRCYANPKAKSTRILKADLARQFAIVLKSEKIENFQDLEAFKVPGDLDEKLASLPALKSKVAIRYFRMLAGDENQVKPDRMVLAFIKSALRKNVCPEEAVNLIQKVCAILHEKHPFLTPRLLDHEIWKYQRGL